MSWTILGISAEKSIEMKNSLPVSLVVEPWHTESLGRVS